MKLSIKKDSTSVLVRIFIQDSSSTTGAGLTGLAYNTASLVCYRARDDDGNAGGTAISLATMTRGTWASGGFVEKDATNLPGWYEFGIPNAAIATGSRSVSLMLKGAANMVQTPVEIELTETNNQDAMRGGMTALPSAVAGSIGGLPVIGTGANEFMSDSAAMMYISSGTGSGQLDIASGVVKSNVYEWLDTLVSLATIGGGEYPAVGSIGLYTGAAWLNYTAGLSENVLCRYVSLMVRSDGAVATDLAAELTNINQDYGTGSGGFTISTDSQEALYDEVLATHNDIGTVLATTNQFVFTVANQVDANALSGGGGLDAAGVRAAVGLATASLDTQLGAIDDFLDTEIAAIKAKTDNIPSDPADASDISSAFGTVNSTLATIAGYIDTEIATLQTSVDDIPTNSELTTALSGLATTTQINTVEGKIDTVDGIVDTITANVTTLINRIGAFTGSGINTVLGFFLALFKKDASNPSDVGGTYAANTDSLEAQQEAGSGGGISLTAEQQAAFEYMLDQVTVGEILSDASNTARIFKTDQTGISLVGQVMVFASDAASANARVTRRVLAHNTATGFITVDSPFSETPTATDSIFFTGYQSSVT